MTADETRLWMIWFLGIKRAGRHEHLRDNDCERECWPKLLEAVKATPDRPVREIACDVFPELNEVTWL